MAECHAGRIAVLPFKRKILTQRMVGEPLPHEDAAKIGVIHKANSHHVVNFALVPIGRRPDVGNGGGLAIIFAHSGLKPKMDAISHRIKLIDHLETGLFTEVIHAGNVDQVIKPKNIACMEADVAKRGERDSERILVAEKVSLSTAFGNAARIF